MKWQNLTDRIRGPVILIILIFTHGSVSVDAAGAQNRAVEPFSVKKCWTAKSENPVRRLIASDNDKTLIYSDSSGKVGALDLALGTRVWMSEFGGEIVSNIISDENRVLFAANPASKAEAKPDSSVMRSISKQTGITVWSLSIPYSEQVYLGMDVNHVLAATAQGAVFAIGKKDGLIKWQLDLNKKLTAAPFFNSQYIVLAAEPGEIFFISALNGERISQITSPSLPISVHMSDPNTLISGDRKGNITAIDIQTKQIKWRFKNGAQVSSITRAGENILASSYDNFVYQMDPSNGNILWKRRLPGRVVEKPLITADFAVVRVLGEPGAFFVDLKSGKVLAKILSESEDDITAAVVLGGDTIVLGKVGGVELYSAGNCNLK